MEEKTPIWALDQAARAAGFVDFDAVSYGETHSTMKSVRSHARMIATYEKPPLDHAQERKELARLLRFMNMRQTSWQVESGEGQEGLLLEYLAIIRERIQ
tara:strand:+ start:627 stop:926 length:300 start_codon:yes stop_codon:yes gene_type:complete